MQPSKLEVKKKSARGTLHLIPLPLAPDRMDTIPSVVIDLIHSTTYYIVENARTARRFIKSTDPPYAIDTLKIFEIDKHGSNDFSMLLSPALHGHDMGLMSEAGCPGIADPGAEFVRKAHQSGIPVNPLPGPSSIFMALMASGLVSQQFAFHSYLPRDKGELAGKLRSLERTSRKENLIQCFIEAPYRNDKMLSACLASLNDSTRLSIAVDINMPEQRIITSTISEWKKQDIPELHKHPAVFSFLAH